MSSTSHQGLGALGGALLGLSTIAVGLRFYARREQKVPLLSDDWMALVAWVMFVGSVSVAFWGLHGHYLGYPEPKSPEAMLAALKPQAQISISFDILSTACFGCVKISALLFYRRIFCVSKRSNRFNIYLLVWVTIVSLWLVTYIVLPPLQCGTHMEALWIESEYAKYCTHSFPYLLSQAISDFLLEVFILLSPIPSIWSLHASVGRRLAISFVFLAALVGFGACIARLVVYVQLDQAATHGKIVDTQLADTKAAFLSIMEGGLSLIAVNLPTLYFLRKHAHPSKVLQSIRSALSLHSEASSEKGSGKDSVTRKDSVDTRSQYSDKSLVHGHHHWYGETEIAIPIQGRDEEAALGPSEDGTF